MKITIDWIGLGKIQKRLDRLVNPDARPLMEQWEDIMTEDNRRGILAGKDKDDQAFKAVKYRPKGAKLRWTAAQQKAVTKRAKFSGPFASGFDNNLSSSEYRRLAGPTLAPRGVRSRIIDHFYTGNGRSGQIWFAAADWFDVVSKKGFRFFPALFAVRDPRGVRAWGRAEMQKSLDEWGNELMRGEAP